MKRKGLGRETVQKNFTYSLNSGNSIPHSLPLHCNTSDSTDYENEFMSEDDNINASISKSKCSLLPNPSFST